MLRSGQIIGVTGLIFQLDFWLNYRLIPSFLSERASIHQRCIDHQTEPFILLETTPNLHFLSLVSAVAVGLEDD